MVALTLPHLLVLLMTTADVAAAVCSTGQEFVPGHGCLHACDDGYQRNTTTGSCDDIDECALGTDHCNPAVHDCRNHPGCVFCDCKPGLVYNPETYLCDDVDECAHPDLNGCDVDTSTCVNVFLGYQCVCKPGYQLDSASQQCVDIDECAMQPSVCPAHSSCINTLAGYECPCDFAHRRSDNSDALTTACTSVCDTTVCAASQIAQPAADGQSCQCICDPQWGTDLTLRPEPDLCCPLGQTWHEASACCVDIACDAGMRLAVTATSASCVDIDECADAQTACGADAACVNSHASYTCNGCGDGFVAAADGRTCVEVTCAAGMHTTASSGDQCRDIDECAAPVLPCGNTTHVCLNTIASYLCVACPDGTRSSSDGRRCVDIDECAAGDVDVCTDVNASCINLAPGYTCQCNAPFVPSDQAPDTCVCPAGMQASPEDAHACEPICQPGDVLRNGVCEVAGTQDSQGDGHDPSPTPLPSASSSATLAVSVSMSVIGLVAVVFASVQMLRQRRADNAHQAAIDAALEQRV